MICLSIVKITLAVDALGQSLLMILKIDNIAMNFLIDLNYGFLYLMYTYLMFFITVDRLLEFKLNIKYPLYRTPKNTLVTTAAASAIVTVAFLRGFISDWLISWNFSNTFLLYVYPPIEGTFVVLSSYTYYIIFQKLKKNKIERENIEQNLNGTEKQKTMKIYMPSFIILTFILFNVIPGLITGVWNRCHNQDQPPKVPATIAFLIPIGWLLDPIIYIFSLKSIRKKIRRVFNQYFGLHG